MQTPPAPGGPDATARSRSSVGIPSSNTTTCMPRAGTVPIQRAAPPIREPIACAPHCTSVMPVTARIMSRVPTTSLSSESRAGVTKAPTAPMPSA